MPSCDHEPSPDSSPFFRVEIEPNSSRPAAIETSPLADSQPERPASIPIHSHLIWTANRRSHMADAALSLAGIDTENFNINHGNEDDNARLGDNVSGQTDEQDNHFYTVESIIGHVVDDMDKTVELLVKWEGYDETTLEPESTMQTDAPIMVYNYWRCLGGRDCATGLNTYHLFRLLAHSDTYNRQGRLLSRRYKVQWEVYPVGDSTWESATKIRRHAPEEKERYDADMGL